MLSQRGLQKPKKGSIKPSENRSLSRNLTGWEAGHRHGSKREETEEGKAGGAAPVYLLRGNRDGVNRNTRWKHLELLFSQAKITGYWQFLKFQFNKSKHMLEVEKFGNYLNKTR